MEGNLQPAEGLTRTDVRFRAKPYLEWVSAIAECDAHHLVAPQLYPAEDLPGVASCLGLTVVEEDLGPPEPEGATLGRLDLERRAIVVSSRLSDHSHPRTYLAGLRRSVIAHEIGHFQLHRAQLRSGILNADQEREAHWYAACFLLPLARLERDPVVRGLLEVATAFGATPDFYLWERLAAVARRFGVCRSLVVKRLVRLGLLERRGKRVILAAR